MPPLLLILRSARSHRSALAGLTLLVLLLAASLALADTRIAHGRHRPLGAHGPHHSRSVHGRRQPLGAHSRLDAAGDQGSKADCAYSANSVAVLSSFERMVGRRFSCVMVFNNASPDWQGWENPWFTHDTVPGYDWSAWLAAPGTHRQLIISQNLFPSALNGSDWLRKGAAGAFLSHARALARNLVAAGLGRSVIRLAHEANDSGSPYWIGSTPAQWQLWRQFWRRTVIAMRSVPGAHFLFDWCINAYWQPVPLRDWYPGDDVVNIVGIDAYDSGVPVGEDRWTRIYTQPDGIRDVLRFAKAHGKPVSLPEWGLAPADAKSLGGGSDPAYIDGIAQIVRNNRIAYQSYFYNHDSAGLLADNRLSLAAYRRHFGPRGDSAGSSLIPNG